MHHSQLEYLIAVQKLQGESAGVRGITLADYMNVSASYIVKLSVYAETNGYFYLRTVRVARNSDGRAVRGVFPCDAIRGDREKDSERIWPCLCSVAKAFHRRGRALRGRNAAR